MMVRSAKIIGPPEKRTLPNNWPSNTIILYEKGMEILRGSKVIRNYDLGIVCLFQPETRLKVKFKFNLVTVFKSVIVGARVVCGNGGLTGACHGV